MTLLASLFFSSAEIADRTLVHLPFVELREREREKEMVEISFGVARLCSDIFGFNAWHLVRYCTTRVSCALQKEIHNSKFHPGSFVTARAPRFPSAEVFAVLFLQLKLTTGTLPN